MSFVEEELKENSSWKKESINGYESGTCMKLVAFETTRPVAFCEWQSKGEKDNRIIDMVSACYGFPSRRFREKRFPREINFTQRSEELEACKSLTEEVEV